mgnify:FL=1
MEFKNKDVLVIGMGISGVGAAALLCDAGARVMLFDSNEKLTMEEAEKKLTEGVKADIYIGTLPDEAAKKAELVVVSPGVPTDTPFIDSFRERSVPIWSEIELAYHSAKGKLIAITGTNGKTTTTALTGQIMKDYMDSVFVVGNIGTPYTLEAGKTTEESVTVAEISSFQLETIHDFKPDASAILNITPDHLNRHHTMEAYVAVKESIARNQDKSSRCVLNYEDPYTREFGNRVSAEPFYFSSARKLEKGIYLEGDTIVLADGKIQPLLNIHEMKLLGTHNVENVMAAIALTYSMGVPLASIIATVKEFRAVEHRIEYVATKKGVEYYNDSKGTNPDAAIKGIQAMNRPTILIGGGYDKGNTYDEWIEAFDGKVKYLVLLGQTREAIAECAKAHGFTNIILADSLEEVVSICAEKAQPGDAVLLSPACASWGMFPNYEVRGKQFKELVHKLED